MLSPSLSLSHSAALHFSCSIEAIDRLFRAGKGGKLQLKKETQKPVVLVLGTGWGAHSLVKVRAPGCSAIRQLAQQQRQVVQFCKIKHHLQQPGRTLPGQGARAKLSAVSAALQQQ